jgi:hypothetical protein
MRNLMLAFVAGFGWVAVAQAQVLMYGDMNVLNSGVSYPSDPRVGATQIGLAPDVVTFANQSFGHPYPFTPYAGDFPGTDQIYTSTNQTAFGDGYSQSNGRLPGPQVLAMNYSSLVPAGQSVQSLTLGIAADDFQFPNFGQPYTANINGFPDAALTNVLNGLDQTGPLVQYFTIGILPSVLLPSDVLTLTINENGNGSDGWAVDFLTIGVGTIPIPEPPAVLLSWAAAAAVASFVRKCRR